MPTKKTPAQQARMARNNAAIASAQAKAGVSKERQAAADASALASYNKVADSVGAPRQTEVGKSAAPRTGVLAIDKATNEVRDETGKVVAKGSTLAEANALATRESSGSAPTVAGRPDMFAVAPNSNQKVEKIAGVDPSVMVTPRTATPDELAQAGAGTLPSYAKSQGLTYLDGPTFQSLQKYLKETDLTRVGGRIYLNNGLTADDILARGKAESSGDPTSITNLSEANDLINSEQAADMASATTADEPPVRTDVEDIMKQIQDAVKPTAEAPGAPNYMKQYAELRASYGIGDLENTLNDLKAEAADILAVKAMRTNAELNKTVATNVIEGRISTVEAQENARLAVIQRSIDNVNNELTTKYGILDTMMKLSQMDYQAAVESYNTQMQTNISFYNAAQNVVEANKTEAQRAQDTARSNAQILINGYSAAGIQYADLSTTQKAELAKLGVQSGLGSTVFETMLSVAPEKEVLTSIQSDDGTKLSIIYKDGTSNVISTGLAPKRTGGGGGGSSSDTSGYKAFSNDAATAIGNLKTGDWDWGTAWDIMRVKYPNAPDAEIDRALGGGFDESRGGWWGRAATPTSETSTTPSDASWLSSVFSK